MAEQPTATDRIQDLAESYLSGGGMSGASISQSNQQTQSLIFNPNIQIGSEGSYLPSVDSGINPNQVTDQSGRTGQPGFVGVPSEMIPEQLQTTASFFSPTVLILIAGAAVAAFLLIR